MSANPVGWFEIYVENMARAKAFYEKVFEVKLEALGIGEPELWKFPQSLTNHGASGALAYMEGFGVGGNSVLVYFTCADCANEIARVSGAGGKVQQEKFSIGEHGFIALAIDTEGNMFGLHSPE